MILLLAQTSTEPISFGPLLFKTLLATAIIIVLAFLVIRYVLPKIQTIRRNRASKIQVLDYQALDNRKAVYIVQIENKKVALGVTEQNVNLLCELESLNPTE